MDVLDSREQNFTKRGGVKEADSAQRKIQEEREATSLMVIYLDPSEIPSTPDEPSGTEYDEDLNFEPEGILGAPPDWVLVSLRFAPDDRAVSN